MTVKTVADLIELLKQLPPDTQLQYASYDSYGDRLGECDIELLELQKRDDGSILVNAEGLEYRKAIECGSVKIPNTLILG